MKIFYHLLALFFPLLLLAQQPENKAIVRMKASLLSLEDGERIVDTLNEIAYQYRSIQPDSAIVYGEKAESLATTIDYQQGIADSHMRLGTAYSKKGAFSDAIPLFENASRERTQLGDYLGAARVYNNLGNLAIQSGKAEEEAITYYNRGLEIIKKAPPDRRWDSEAKLYINSGYTHTLNGAYAKAFEALQEGLRLALVNGSKKREAAARLNLGIYYHRLDNTTQARDEIARSLSIYQEIGNQSLIAKCYNELGNVEFHQGNFKNALEQYEQALATGGLSIYEEALIRNNQGVIYSEQGKSQLALERHKQSLELFKRMDNQRRIALANFDIGFVYYTQSDYQKSISYFETALDELEGVKAPDILSQALYHMSLAHSELGNIEKALEYSRQNLVHIDSIYQKKESALNLTVNLKTAQSAMANIEAERAEQKSNLMLVYGGSAIAFLLLLLLLAVAGLLLNREKRLVAEQREELAYQEIDTMLKAGELETTYARLKGEEEARIQIGKDLHGRIGSMLTTVKLYFSTVDERMVQIEEASKEQYKKIAALIDETAEEVRRISHNMTSLALTKYGLRVQLEEMVRQIREAGKIEVELHLFGIQERLSLELEKRIYQIIQELVANALKYAKASSLSIQLNRFEQVINIMVEDDGVGFDPEVAEKEGGMGLSNVRSWVHHLNGTMQIDSGSGEGATITVDIEYDEPN